MWPFKKIKQEPIKAEEKKEPDPAKEQIPVKVKKDRFDIVITLGCGKEFGYNQIHEQNKGKTCIGCFLNFYFPRSLILLAEKQNVRLAPIYSEFGEIAKEALRYKG